MSTQKLFASVQDKFMPEAIDIVDAETGKGVQSKQSLEEIRLRYPNAVLMEVHAFHTLRENLAKTEPVKISEEEYVDALECLPPLNFINRGATESFKMSERYTGRITSVYARLGTTYWTFRDIDTMSHQEILDRIAAAEEKDEPITPA